MNSTDIPALVWSYDSTELTPPGSFYPNCLYEHAHKSALGTGTWSARCKMLPAKSADGPDGFHILVLLDYPFTALCIETGQAVHVAAAILREYKDGSVEGWFVNSHAAAVKRWREEYPEATP